jgi:hypothetical protein
MAVVSSGKSRGTGSGGNRDRKSTILATVVIVGALCLRVFRLPTRSNVDVMPQFQSLQVKLPKEQHSDTEDAPQGLLPINPTGTMAADILSMRHVPKNDSIVIDFHPDGRCPRPYLRGRLSGPALVLLEWSSGTHAAQQIGQYRVPVSGTYFLEIIVITCQDFSRSIDFDFQNTCLEDPQNHRLTRSNVRISIQKNPASTTTTTAAASGIRHKSTLGYWMHQSDERAAGNDYTAMYTRFQPRGCLRLDDPTHEHFHMPPQHCIEPTNWNRYEPYTRFRYYEPDGRPKMDFPPTAKDIQATHPTTICLLGASHSRTIKASMVNYHNFSYINNNIQIEWINAKYPRNIPNQTITEEIAGKCHKIILAVGQWPASFSGGKPTLFASFQLEMTKLFGRLQDHLPPGTEVWARSIHENPLNERIAGYCPPRDWRSPTVVEGYNMVIRQAVANARPGIQFVDTSFIVSPLWDASTDWGHVCPQASHVEALYLVAVVMGLVEPNT